jgi:hypothetical protein
LVAFLIQRRREVARPPGIWATMKNGKRVAFGVVFATLLAVVTLAGLETLASFYVPPWPARAMNPRPPAPVRVLGPAFKNQPWLADPDNSWGMRDRERTIAKPPGAVRAIFVGDSFVESRFTPLSLPAAVEARLLPAAGTFEAVNLAVGATDPRSYYFRIRDVALDLQPDALLLFIYAGNDFMNPDQGYSMWPDLTDESPGGSLVGQLMPRTNWLLVNRLGLAAFFRSRSKAPANDETMLYEAVTAPPQERLLRTVSYVHTYHFPEVSEAKIAEVLSRGGNRLLEIALPHAGEQEYLLDWMFDSLMSWESGSFEAPSDRQDASRFAGDGHVEATLSWIKATQELARRANVPLVVFLAPVGSVDPDYVEFWKPWPRAFGWNYICEEWQARLDAALTREAIRHVDLSASLSGVPGTYRKLDGHWTQKGEAIVADRVSGEVSSLLNTLHAAAPPTRMKCINRTPPITLASVASAAVLYLRSDGHPHEQRAPQAGRARNDPDPTA